MQALIDGANGAVWEWKLQNHQILIDNRWAGLLGYSIKELAPLTFGQWLGLIHPADRDAATQQLTACSRMGARSYEMHYRAKRKSGEYIWVVDRAKLFDLTKSGTNDSLIGTRQNINQLITNQEKLRVIEDTFSNSFYHSGIGMALVSTDGKWLKVNPALSNMLGYTEAEFFCLTFQDITHPDDLQADLELLYETIDGKRESYQMEKRYQHKQGPFLDAILCVSAVRGEDGEVLYFVSQIIDISERKHLERLKNDFISTVSHELRTPLTSILGSIKLILSGKLNSSQSLPAKVSHLLKIAQENTERLAFLVNDLLDIEKISEGGMTYEIKPHQLVFLNEKAISSVAHYGEHLIIRAFSPAASQAVVKVDEQRFTQVVINLLSNAIKF